MKITKSLIGTALICSSFFFQSFQNRQEEKETNKEGVELFQKSCKNYSYFIEGLGTVKIDNAMLNGMRLTTTYHYFSEGENRKGNSSHKLQRDGTYKGTWESIADNGNSYQGTSWFKFNDDGTASGKWDWNGIPGIYEIRIDKN